MKVGDLVKVYDFSWKAREWYIEQGEEPQDVNRHFVGIITANDQRHVGFPEHRTVLRVGSRDQIQYNINRMEVINESR